MGKTFERILILLDRNRRRDLWKVLAVSIGMGAAEMTAVLSVTPFLIVATDTEAARQHNLLAAAYGFFGFTSNRTFLIGLAIGSLAMLCGAILSRIGGHYYLRSFVRLQSVSLAARLAARYMSRPLDHRPQRHSAELVSNIQSEVERIVNGVLMNSVRLLTGTSTATFLCTMLIVVQPRAAMTMAMLLGCGYFAVFAAVRRPMQHNGQERLEATREAARLLSEALVGSREVALYGMERQYLERLESAYRRKAESTTTSDLLRDIPKSILEILTFSTMILLVIWTLYEKGDSSSALPLVALYAFAAARLFPSLQRIYASAAAMRADLPALDDLFADLVAASRIARQPVSETPPLRLRETLELRAANYRYPGSRRQQIKDLDLCVQAGSITGLVGATGAGKSTILDIITGLISPDSGTLTVDGNVIDSENAARWRASIAYVPQDSCMIEGTIRENIVFGAKNANDASEAFTRATAFAGLDALITELPEGFDTILGERGLNLSMGQRQRIGIARAIFRSPALLVLDETTSALDTISESHLNKAVQSLRGKTTVVIVAHRLTTVRDCDLIYLIGDGRVLEFGTYGELTSDSSKFLSFHRAGT